MSTPTPAAPPLAQDPVLPDHLSDPATTAATASTSFAEDDAADFDLNAWIGAVDRPEDDVRIYNADAAWQERYELAARTWRNAEARLRAAIKEAEGGGERSVTDLGPASYEAAVDDAAAALEDLRREREASALVVRVRQLTGGEISAACAPALQAGHTPDEAMRFAVASAIVSVTTGTGRKATPFTGEQLLTLERRDVSGYTAVEDLISKVNVLSRRPSVPSSPGSSTSRGTDTSSAR